MALAFRRLSVLAVAFLLVLASMVLTSGPASAKARTVGPILSASDCRIERTTYRRYYDSVSNCFFDSRLRAYFFIYDDES